MMSDIALMYPMNNHTTIWMACIGLAIARAVKYLFSTKFRENGNA